MKVHPQQKADTSRIPGCRRRRRDAATDHGVQSARSAPRCTRVAYRYCSYTRCFSFPIITPRFTAVTFQIFTFTVHYVVEITKKFNKNEVMLYLKTSFGSVEVFTVIHRRYFTDKILVDDDVSCSQILNIIIHIF